MKLCDKCKTVSDEYELCNNCMEIVIDHCPNTVFTCPRTYDYKVSCFECWKENGD